MNLVERLPQYWDTAPIRAIMTWCVREDSGLERMVTIPVGVVVERQDIDNPWQRWRWRPVAVMTGEAPAASGSELLRGEGFVRYFAGTLPLELHRKETEAYRRNLSNEPPTIYVALRSDSAVTGDMQYRPVEVTASPYIAEDLLDGDDIVEALPMPEGLIAWVQAFIDKHHVDEPFVKRKRRGGSATGGRMGGRWGHSGPPGPGDAQGRGGQGRGGHD